MTDETKHANPAGHGNFERRDIRIADVIYFLLGLAVFLVLTHFVVTGVFHMFDKRNQEEQPPLSPLVTNAPTDTRHLPPQYKTDAESTSYEKYLQKNFPAPQLETDELDQLDKIRLHEEQTLSTYGYVDQSAGIVRIPIERAMDLLARQGLPVRSESTSTASTTSGNQAASSTKQAASSTKKEKGIKQ